MASESKDLRQLSKLLAEQVHGPAPTLVLRVLFMAELHLVSFL